MNLTLVLTHQCNLACHYCYAGEKANRRMSWETAKASLDGALADPDPKLDLAFFGGEPLLEWDLLVRATEYAEAGAAARGKRLRLLVTTNGTRMSEERLAWLLEHRFFIGLSMDGAASAMARARPFKSGRSSFEAVENALERLVASGTERYEVLVVVDPSTAPWLDESVDYLVAKGARRISFNPNFFTAWDEDAKEGWRRGYARAAFHYLDAYRRGRPLYMNWLESKIVTGVKGGFGGGDRCNFGGRELAVAPSGNLYPCERLVGDDRDPTWVIGSVGEGLDTVRVAKAGKGCGNDDPECAVCPLKSRCMNWCGCTNFLETGDGTRPGENLCFHEKMVIPMADEVGRALYLEGNPAFMANFYFEEPPGNAPGENLAIAV